MRIRHWSREKMVFWTVIPTVGSVSGGQSWTTTPFYLHFVEIEYIGFNSMEVQGMKGILWFPESWSQQQVGYLRCLKLFLHHLLLFTIVWGFLKPYFCKLCLHRKEFQCFLCPQCLLQVLSTQQGFYKKSIILFFLLFKQENSWTIFPKGKNTLAKFLETSTFL